jgi:hypothetical protein
MFERVWFFVGPLRYNSLIEHAFEPGRQTMSTILIDRRTAVLLGELAARPGPDPVDGGASRPAVRNRAEVAATRRESSLVPTSVRPVEVTVRTPRAAGRELPARLQCRPSQVSRAGARRPAAVAAARPVRPMMWSARPGLHLTRRGRLVALLLLLAVLTVAFSVGRVTSTALGDPSAPAASTVVERGDTVWSIAERIAPNADPRETAVDLMAVNGLATPELQVGQTLRLP